MSPLSRKFSKFVKISFLLILIFLLIAYMQLGENVIITGSTSISGSSTTKSSVNDYSNYLQGFINKDGSVASPVESSKTVASENAVSNSNVNSNKALNSDKAKFNKEEKIVGNSNSKDTASSSDKSKALKEFYSQIFDSLRLHSPTGKSERNYKESCKLDGNIGDRPDYYKDWYKLSKNSLENCLEINESDFKMLKSKHDSFVDSISKLTLPKETYTKKGIVMVGGGKFSVLAFLIVKTLRNLGTTLPVEVFIPPQDESERNNFCKDTLPKYNAKCIFISDILPEEQIKKVAFKGYQFKSIAMIASSFDDLLLLDADNFPIKKLDTIFEQEPYKSSGLVLWPDFWRRTTAPIYYQIADVPIDYSKRVRNSMDDLTPPEIYTENLKQLQKIPLHDFQGTIPDPSTESGQLLIKKTKHLPTLLLSLYYNINGPNWYYPMFSQKAAGEGDKETFIAAAVYYDLPFYQVRTKTGVDGYHQEDGKGFRGVAMLQHDFVQDYNRYKRAKETIQSIYKNPESRVFDKDYSSDEFYKKYILKEFSEDENDKGEVDVMFVHSNLPKFDPISLWKVNDLIVDGQQIRGYRAMDKLNNYDLELENFKIFHHYLCIKKVKFPYVEENLTFFMHK